MKFKFYSANTTVNGISVAVYENEDGTYTLQAEKDGERVEGTHSETMTVEEYENLPYTYDNGMVRFQAALAECGLYLH